MNTGIKTIATGDTIFATAKVRGSFAANLRLSGICSISDAINAVRNELGALAGLTTITLRNMTRGWTQEKSVYLSPIAIKTRSFLNS